MKTADVKLDGTYRMKPEVFAGSVQKNGEPFQHDHVTVVRIQYPAGKQTPWCYDRAGNAFRPKDFAGVAEVIDIEL